MLNADSGWQYGMTRILDNSFNLMVDWHFSGVEVLEIIRFRKVFPTCLAGRSLKLELNPHKISQESVCILMS